MNLKQLVVQLLCRRQMQHIQAASVHFWYSSWPLTRLSGNSVGLYVWKGKAKATNTCVTPFVGRRVAPTDRERPVGQLHVTRIGADIAGVAAEYVLTTLNLGHPPTAGQLQGYSFSSHSIC
jgi:hypothetical protein